MLKIGEFSRLTQISIKALHIYADRGLLQPEHVDKFSGYRYYTLQQLPRAHRIMALKGMGLSLEQIGITLSKEMSIDELRGMFRLKQAEIEQRVREDQQRLAMIEFHINMINAEDKMSELDIVVKQVAPIRALFLKLKAKNTIVSDVGTEIMEAVKNRGIVYQHNIGIVYGDELNPDENMEYVFALSVDASQIEPLELASYGTMNVSELPAVLAATTIKQGPSAMEYLETQTLLKRWAVENNYRFGDEMRTIHLKGPMHGAPISEWVSEFQVIIEPQAQE